MAPQPKKCAAEDSTPAQPPKRICLVTCGATAPFPLLVESVLTPTFLSKLRSLSYTDLWIQYGALPPSRYNELVSRLGTGDRWSIAIEGFAYGRGEAWRTMLRAVKATQLDARNGEVKEVQQIDDGVMRREGVIISHAGTYDPVLNVDVLDLQLQVEPPTEEEDEEEE